MRFFYIRLGAKTMKKVAIKECKTCIWLVKVNEQKATCPFAGCLKGVGKAGRPDKKEDIE